MNNTEENENEGLSKDYYIIRETTCPNCEENFKYVAIRTRRIRFKTSHQSLRPEYYNEEPLLHDVMFCPNCGYARLKSKFDSLRDTQKEIFQEEVGNKFKKQENILNITIEQAILRYKFAIVSAKIMNFPPSEIAMVYYKLSWLYEISRNTNGYLDSIKNALNYFEKSLLEETFPVMSMDIHTVEYIMAYIFKVLGDDRSCIRYCSEIVISDNANDRIKNRAIDLKNELLKARGEEEEDNI